MADLDGQNPVGADDASLQEADIVSTASSDDLFNSLSELAEKSIAEEDIEPTPSEGAEENMQTSSSENLSELLEGNDFYQDESYTPSLTIDGGEFEQEGDAYRSTAIDSVKQVWEHGFVEGEFWVKANLLENGANISSLDLDKIVLIDPEKLQNIWNALERESGGVFQLNNLEAENPYETFAAPLKDPAYIYHPDSGAEIEIGTDWTLIKEGAQDFRLEKISDLLNECSKESPELGKAVGDNYSLYGYVEQQPQNTTMDKLFEELSNSGSGFEGFAPNAEPAFFDESREDLERDEDVSDFQKRLEGMNSDLNEVGQEFDASRAENELGQPRQQPLNRDAVSSVVDGASRFASAAATNASMGLGAVLKSLIDRRSHNKLDLARKAASEDGRQETLQSEVSRSALLASEMKNLSAELSEAGGREPYKNPDEAVRAKSERLAKVLGEFERSSEWMDSGLNNSDKKLDSEEYSAVSNKIADMKESLTQFGKSDIKFRNEEGEVVHSEEEAKKLKERLEEMLKAIKKAIKDTASKIKNTFTM